jgi:hypothetical protein
MDQMWKRHCRTHGRTCDDSCECYLCIPSLVDGWENPVHLSGNDLPRSLLGNFAAKFMTRLREEYVDDTPMSLLRRLESMWSMHEDPQCMPPRCLADFVCEAGWEVLFYKGALEGEKFLSNVNSTEETVQPMHGKPEKASQSNALAVEVDSSNICTTVISVDLVPSSALGFYCVTELRGDGRSVCKILSIDPFGQLRSKDTRIQVCAEVVEASFDDNDSRRYQMPRHTTLKKSCERARKQKSKVRLWILNAGASEVESCDYQWTAFGALRGSPTSGWDGPVENWDGASATDTPQQNGDSFECNAKKITTPNLADELKVGRTYISSPQMQDQAFIGARTFSCESVVEFSTKSASSYTAADDDIPSCPSAALLLGEEFQGLSSDLRRILESVDTSSYIATLKLLEAGAASNLSQADLDVVKTKVLKPKLDFISSQFQTDPTNLDAKSAKGNLEMEENLIRCYVSSCYVIRMASVADEWRAFEIAFQKVEGLERHCNENDTVKLEVTEIDGQLQQTRTGMRCSFKMRNGTAVPIDPELFYSFNHNHSAEPSRKVNILLKRKLSDGSEKLLGSAEVTSMMLSTLPQQMMHNLVLPVNHDNISGEVFLNACVKGPMFSFPLFLQNRNDARGRIKRIVEKKLPNFNSHIKDAKNITTSA